MIMMLGWRRARLGEFGEFRNGVNFDKGQKVGDIRLINVKDIFDGHTIDFESLDTVDLNELGNIERFLVHEGDLFFVRSSVKRDGVGLVSIAKRSDDATVHCGFVIRFRLNSAEFEPLFLTYLLRSQRYREVIIGLSGGSAITNISQDSLASLEVDIPPLPTQRRIASILSAYDDLIENNMRRIKILEEMAQRLYREWFVHFRFPRHEKVKMVKGAPKGWEVKRLGEIAGINSSSVKKGDELEEIHYVDIASVSTGSIDQVTQMHFKDAPGRARRAVRHGDIIWSCVRPNRKSYSIVVDPLPNLIVSTGFAVITAKSVPYTYLYYVVTTDEFVGYLTNHATGAAYPAVSTSDFENAKVLVPPNALLKKFHLAIDDFFVEQNILKRKNANLRRTRDMLLPKLVSGEVEVGD